jgi:Small Multidrug Resistance protein
MRVLPLGTAYVIWTGIGAVGAFVVGIAVLGEQVTALRVGSAVFILIGLIGLKMASDHQGCRDSRQEQCGSAPLGKDLAPRPVS